MRARSAAGATCGRERIPRKTRITARLCRYPWSAAMRSPAAAAFVAYQATRRWSRGSAVNCGAASATTAIPSASASRVAGCAANDGGWAATCGAALRSAAAGAPGAAVAAGCGAVRQAHIANHDTATALAHPDRPPRRMGAAYHIPWRWTSGPSLGKLPPGEDPMTTDHIHFGDSTRQAALFETMILAAAADGSVDKVELHEIYRRVFERPEFHGIQAEDLRKAIEHAARRVTEAHSLEHIL